MNYKTLLSSHLSTGTTDSPSTRSTSSTNSSTNSNNDTMYRPTYSNNTNDEEKAVEVPMDDVPQGEKPAVSFSQPPAQMVKRGLTEVSAMFDRNGKGYLDDTERALRRMDSQNQGYLGIDKVCVIFESLQAEQERSSELLEALREEGKKSMNLKKGVIALACFSILLAVANVGTSFAIAQLVKDMKVDGDSVDLISKSNGVRVGTTSKLVNFEMQGLDETRRRRLQQSSTLLCEQMVETLEDGVTTEKSCQLQGLMKNTQAQAVHAQLAEVDMVMLNCNGRRSEIQGGTHFMGTPGVLNMGVDYMIYPDASNGGRKYQAIQNVIVPGVRGDAASGILPRPSRFCDANFELAMYCPTELVNGEEEECLVMTAFLPTIECPTPPEICGPVDRRSAWFQK